MNSSYQLSLLITEQCNLRCSYCYCDKRRNGEMPYEAATKAINDTMKATGSAPLKLLLMGGEPFLAFDLMRQIVEYIRTRYPERKVIVKTVTNGTLVHGEVQKWLTQNKDIFYTCLSLDGSREDHNRNRCNSYDKIDIDFFIRTYGDDAEVSMVACPESMDHLASNVIELQERGFRVKCVLADDCHWDIEKDPKRWSEQLGELIDYYLNHPEMMPFNQLREALNIVGGNLTSEKCMPGMNSHCIDTDGNYYECHRCTPYFNNDTWHIPTGKSLSANSDLLHIGCSQCPAQKICLSCPALVASLKDDSQLAQTMCAMFKVTHLSNAVFVARLFTECLEHIRLRQMNDAVKRDYINGAQLLLNNL